MGTGSKTELKLTVEIGIQAHKFLRGKLVLETTYQKGKNKLPINQIIKDTKELIQKYSILRMGLHILREFSSHPLARSRADRHK